MGELALHAEVGVDADLSMIPQMPFEHKVKIEKRKDVDSD